MATPACEGPVNQSFLLIKGAHPYFELLGLAPELTHLPESSPNKRRLG